MYLHAVVNRRSILCWLGIFAVVGVAVAWGSGADEHRLPLHTIQFDTDEGTFMNVDVSPDGETIAFDLLGQIYALPLSGGKAEPLLAGSSFDQCPRYSPDGKQIAFVSDQTGFANVWVMNVKTRAVRQITRLKDAGGAAGSVGCPLEWLPDGQELVFGSESGRQRLSIVPIATGEPRFLEPDAPPTYLPEKPDLVMIRKVHSASFTPDGLTAFFSETQDNHHLSHLPQAIQTRLYRIDMASHKRELLTDPVEGRNEFAPVISHGGHLLAYCRENAPNDIELRIRNLPTGEDRRLTILADADDPDDSDAQSGAELPGYSFTPDDQFVVIWFGGKIHKVPVEGGASMVVPFTVHVVREVANSVQARYRIQDGPLRIRAIRWPFLSRDGHRLIFSANGYLWGSQLPRGKPSRLTNGDDFEYAPAVSPDEHRVAYVASNHTQDRVGLGKLRILDLSSGQSRAVVTVSSEHDASYYIPSWSPDGTKLAVIRETGQGKNSQANFGWVDIGDGVFHSIAPADTNLVPATGDAALQWVSFSADGTRLLFSHYLARKIECILESAKLDGADKLVLATAEGALGMVPSPDLSQAALINSDSMSYITQLFPRGLETNARPAHVMVLNGASQRIDVNGSYFPVWQDSKTLIYTSTDHLYRYRVGDSVPEAVETVLLDVTRQEGRGIVAFRNLRLITVAGAVGAAPVIEHGTVVVQGRRIEAVGPESQVSIPPGAKVIDASGLTMMPGLVDVHYHGLQWVELARDHELPGPRVLAYGVTTALEALGSGTFGDGYLTLAELREEGRSIGPRWFFVDGRVDGIDCGAEEGASMEAAKAYEGAKVALGAEQILKQSCDVDRSTAQRYAEAARELGVGIMAHTGTRQDLLTRATDGYAVEHEHGAPLYRDVQEFLARSGTIWTPTMLAANWTDERSFFDEVRGRNRTDAAKLDRYAASFLSLPEFAQAPMIPYDQTQLAQVARAVASVMAAGGKVAIGGHDPAGGVDTYGEMWALVRGGASPEVAIRAGTMTGAEKLGIQKDVGSITPGKIADLVLLNGNPLVNIENLLSIKYVVADGVIYDGDTLEVIDPKQTIREKVKN